MFLCFSKLNHHLISLTFVIDEACSTHIIFLSFYLLTDKLLRESDRQC